MIGSNISHAATQGLIPDMVPDEKKGLASGIKAMLEEEAEELAGGVSENEEAPKDLTAPLVSAEPEIASMVSFVV